MKNQYFGDIRDLFKYDLIQYILEGIDSPERNITFIPMLTKDEDGNKKKKDKERNKRNFKLAQCWGRPGTKNKSLMDFLEKCNKKYEEAGGAKRDFREIESYFTKIKGLKMYIHEKDGYFTKDKRNEYFDSVPVKLKGNSLIFVDPDTGLEPEKSGASEKHLKYKDVKKLHKHMSTNSILMIYQHFPNDRSSIEYLPSERANKLRDELKDGIDLKYWVLPLYLSDNEISFLFLTKNDKLRKKLAEILAKYIDTYYEFFQD